MQRICQILMGLVVIMAASLPAALARAGALADQLAGTWDLVSNTEAYADGSSYQWGPDAHGQLILQPNGTFSLQMGVGDRKPQPGNPALNPVGRYIAYFGTYTADDTAKTLTFKITRASFPAWDGTEQTRVVSEIGDAKMVYTVAKPIPTDKGPLTPTLVWSRVK